MADLIATGEVFATGASTTGPYTLTIGGSAVSQAVVTAMHQTDWQGRLALSNAPRTNLVTDTDLTSATWTSLFPAKGTCTVAPTPIPGPTQTYQIVSGTAVSTAADSCIISGNFTASAGAYSSSCFVSSGSYAAACVAVVVNGSQPHVVQIDPATGAMMGFDSVITGGLAQLLGTRTSIGQWVRVTLQIAAPSGTTFLNIRIGGVPTYGYSGSFGNDGKGIYASSPTLEAGSYAGVYIPTTTAPVTVTDYAVSGRTVSLGQVPANATLDWDGQGTFGNWSWPSTLPLPIANGSLQYAPIIEPVLATSMETGAPKYRRRMTYVPETCQATVELTGDQWTTLINFYNTMLVCVNPFDWKDFRTGSTATYVFTKQPAPVQMQDQPKYWSVQLQLLKVA